ncbi:flagellar hook-associated protein FlgL, partial [Nitrospinota bacterium]
MVTRVTTAQRFAVALRAIQNTQTRVQDIQEEIVTGKRVSQASDDPGSFSKILDLRRILSDSNQFTRNIQRSTAFSNITDETLQSIRNLILQARGIGLEQAGAPADELTRAGAAVQVAKIRESILQLANTQVGGRYIFSGTEITTKAYNDTGEFQGNQGELKINVGIEDSSPINIVGSSFLTTDLNPDLYVTSSNMKSTAAVTDEFIIDASNQGLVVQEQPSGTKTTVTLATATYTGDALATEAELKINNNIKVVTASNNTIKILEDGGTVSDTITIAAGVKAGGGVGGVADLLQNAINASVTLKGSTAAGGAGYTVTYTAATDKFTIETAEGTVASVGIDTTSGTDLAKLMGFTQAATFTSKSVTSDEALTGTNVTYDEATDRFTISRSGADAPKFQVLSVGTDAASTAANLFGFTSDSLESTTATSATATAFNIITGTNDTFSVQVDGGTNTAITIGAGVFTGEALATKIELAVNNSVKEVTASNNTIKIFEDGGARSDTFTVTTGTRTGSQIASDLQTAINNSTLLKGSPDFNLPDGPAGTGYTVSYSAANDKFTITAGSPAVSTGVDVSTGNDLAALMGFTAASPFAASVTSDTAITGAKVDYDASFKDSFTVISPTTGASS